MNKPTSKVIQIVSAASASTTHHDTVHKQTYLTALCEDGSIWDWIGNGEWECVLNRLITKKQKLSKDRER